MNRKNFILQSTALLTVPSLSPFANKPETKTMESSKICATCGTQYPSSASREVCVICNDDRQYVPDSGQSWTTHNHLLLNNSVRILKLKDRVHEFVIKPTFAIGQRALFIESEGGNILWDCIPLLNEPTIDFIKMRGGLKAIAFSHPHYYSNMNDWAETFNCPIYIHQNDEQWIMDKGKHINLWSGSEKSLWDGIQILNIGGHFPGSSVLRVPSLSKDGALFCGDTMVISPSKKHIAVMYSYPNRIPLPLQEVNRIRKRMEAIPFDTMYTFLTDQNLEGNAREAVSMSFERYL
jgi:glyoxylase-like metal-dependent hydrolase (beta-lactamase superfamily II)